MSKLVIHTMHPLFSVINQLRKAGVDQRALAPLILLLPLSLGLPLAIWLAGGRGSSAASCVLITMWRAVMCAMTGHRCPSTAARSSLPA